MTDFEERFLLATKWIKTKADSWWYLMDNMDRKAGMDEALELLQPLIDEIESKYKEDD